MSTEDIRTDLDSLIAEIVQLNIQHSNISNRLIAITRRVKEIQHITNRVEIEPSRSSDSSDSRSFSIKLKRKFSVGDRVIIKNPEKGRPQSGIVIDYTPAGFVKVDLQDGKRPLRRLPLNLKKDE